MLTVEIVLIVAGVLCISISFFVSRKKESSSDASDVPKGAEIWTEKDEEVIIKHIDEILEKRGMELVETTEDQMNRICNEKIMAIDEFTKPLLDKINVNHEEVVFMYNMLNEKQKELKETIMEDTVRRSVPVIEPVQAETEAVTASQPAPAPAPEPVVKTVPTEAPVVTPPAAPKRVVMSATAPVADTPAPEVITPAVMPSPAPRVTHESEVGKYAESIISATKANNTTGLQRLGAAPPETIPEIVPVREPVPEVVAPPEPQPAEVVQKPELSPEEQLQQRPSKETVMQQVEDTSSAGRSGAVEDRVHALYKAGRSVVDISKELNIGQGEVKLMIAMYKKRHR